MLAERVRAGVRVGLVAASATAGILVGFGARRGTATLHFDALGSAALTGALPPAASVTAFGVLLHVATVIIWATAFTVAAWRVRGTGLALATVLFAGLAYLANAHFISPPLRLGFAGGVGPREVAAFYIALAASLFAGMRLAL